MTRMTWVSSGRRSRFLDATGAALVAVLLTMPVAPGEARAEGQQPVSPAEFEAMRREVRALREQNAALFEEVADLRADQGRDWITERRSEQVEALVREVLADADQRAALLDSAVTAGHDGDFYLQNTDGSFRLEFAGHFQARYIFNSRDDSGGDDNQFGFQIRRAKFKPAGYLRIADRTVTFATSLAGNRAGGNGEGVFEDYYVQTELLPGLDIRVGRWKQPFALQNLRSSSRQLAVERSTVHEVFAVDRSEGVMLASSFGDATRFMVSINDGIDAEATDFHADNADFAVTSRVEHLLPLDGSAWNRFKDVSSWSDDEGWAGMLGAAVHYELAARGRPMATNDDFLLWTADLSLEGDGLGVMIAGYGKLRWNEATADTNDFGFLAEAGYMIVPDRLEPFGRYEWIRTDPDSPVVTGGGTKGSTHIVTAGLNWYHVRHRSKFTIDLVYALDPITANLAHSGAGDSSGLGLQTDAAGQDGQWALRTQYQLKW